MDAWASPWADDAIQQDESQSYEKTISEPPNAEALPQGGATATSPAPQNIFGTKLHDTSYGSPSVWEAGPTLFGVDSSSAWASDSPSDPSEWNNNQAQSINVGFTSPALVHQSPSFPGELSIQPDLVSSVTCVGSQTSKDWSLQLQPDWDSLSAADLPTAKTSPTINQVKSDSLAVQVPPLVITQEKVPLDEYSGSTGSSTLPIKEHLPPRVKELKLNVDTEKDRGVQPGQQDDDFDDFGDFGDFGDYAEDGEIEEIGFAPEPAHLVNSHVPPLSPLDFTIAGSLVSKLYPTVPKTLPMPPVEDVISTTAAYESC